MASLTLVEAVWACESTFLCVEDSDCAHELPALNWVAMESDPSFRVPLARSLTANPAFLTTDPLSSVEGELASALEPPAEIFDAIDDAVTALP